MFNKKGFQYIDSSYGVVKFLDYLERQCGGSGNGVALYKNEKIVFFKKGVKYTNEEIYKTLISTDFDYCMYHTRIASVGSVTDKNCHPFRKGNTTMCMNGTEPGFKGVAEMLDITDTEAIFRTSIAFTQDLIKVCRDMCKSTFIGFVDGKPFVTAHTAVWSGIQFMVQDGIEIFASTLPNEIKVRNRAKVYPFLWTPDTDMSKVAVEEAPKQYESRVTTYGRGYYDNLFDYQKVDNSKGWQNVGGTNVKVETVERAKPETKAEKNMEKKIESVKNAESKAKSQRYVNGQWEDDPDYSEYDEPIDAAEMNKYYRRYGGVL